jgi:geranylgeranylglycerol-phosphate geranylgeranyltransferase
LTVPDSIPLASIPHRFLAVVFGYARLFRLPNLLMVVIGVFVGAALEIDQPVASLLQSGKLSLAALAAVLIAGGANALNDAMDVDVDSINRPMRPLVIGTISMRMALVWAALLVVAGIVVAWSLSPAHLQLAIAVAVLMIAYDLWLKRLPLIGNVAVAISVAATLVFGAITTGTGSSVAVGAVFAFSTTLAREIIKDLEDRSGDAQSGFRTLPVVAGESVAITTAACALCGSLILIPIPYVWMEYSGLYLLLGLFAAGAIVGSLWMMVRRNPERSYTNSSRLVKLGMLAGLAALFVSHAPA